MPRCLTLFSMTFWLMITCIIITWKAHCSRTFHPFSHTTPLIMEYHVAEAEKLLLFQKMDINKVSFEELVLLPGIGAVKAASILSFKRDIGFVLDMNETAYIDTPFSISTIITMNNFLTTGKE